MINNLAESKYVGGYPIGETIQKLGETIQKLYDQLDLRRAT